MTEKWLPVVGFEGKYEVSDHGQVRSLQMGVVLRLIVKRGYHKVVLSQCGVKKLHSVHRLVLSAHVGTCPDGMEACHNNGIKTDNRVENLRWDTHSENILDSVRHGRKPAPESKCFSLGHDVKRSDSGKLRCRDCDRARDRSYSDLPAARVRRKEQRLAKPVPDHVHGSDNGYTHYDCRCNPCTEAHRAFRRDYYARNESAAARRNKAANCAADKRIADSLEASGWRRTVDIAADTYPQHQRYESCVTDAAGRCTRSSHDHFNK